MAFHLILDSADRDVRGMQGFFGRNTRYKLIDPRWIGIKGAFATRSPSGAKSAHEKSSRSLMLVLMDVCWSDLPIASATLMKRLANSVRRMGSGPLWLAMSRRWVSIDLGRATVLVSQMTPGSAGHVGDHSRAHAFESGLNGDPTCSQASTLRKMLTILSTSCTVL